MTDRTDRAGYRPNQAVALRRIETARIAAGISVARLAAQAGISERSYYNQRRSGRAFPRTVTALSMALRTLTRADTQGGEMFP